MTLADTSKRKEKRLRQDEPLTSMLFNIVTDMLAIIIEPAKNNGPIEEVVSDLLDDGLSIFNMIMIHSLYKTLP
jgi:hypothetical protein